MLALTIQQPFASAIVHGPKRIENRMWRPPPYVIGQRIAIHAGKTVYRRGTPVLQRLWGDMPELESLPRGAILGTARLASVQPLATAPPAVRMSPWSTGPICWCLDRVRALDEPVYCRGRRRLWRVPSEIQSMMELGPMAAHEGPETICSACGAAGANVLVCGSDRRSLLCLPCVMD
jgi:hypothetical protein